MIGINIAYKILNIFVLNIAENIFNKESNMNVFVLRSFFP